MEVWHHVLCIGDSQVAGSRAHAGWPALLNIAFRRKTETGAEWVGINEGVAGETSSQILDRTVKVLYARPNIPTVIFLMGANDARGGVPLEVSESCYRSCLVLALSNSRSVIGLVPPAMERGRGHVTAGGGYFEDAARRLVHIQAVQLRVLHEYGLPILDLGGVLGHEHFVDAVHFNDAGQMRIAEAVAELVASL